MIIPWIAFLKEDEQLLIETPTRRRTVNGPGAVITPALARICRRQAIPLGPTDYLRVRDTLSGGLHNEIGPKLVFLGPGAELDLDKMLARLYITYTLFNTSGRYACYSVAGRRPIAAS